MPRNVAFLYGRHGLREPLETQLRRVFRYWESRLQAEFDLCETPYIDEPQSGHDFREREAGKALDAQLGRGDAVLVSSVGMAFNRLEDLAVRLRVWSRRGVLFHAITEKLNTSQLITSEEFSNVLCTLVRVRDTRRCEAVREALARNKAQGLPVNGHPGYGYKWQGRRGKRRRVVDEEERAVMAKIVTWRDHDGWTIEDVFCHLRQKRILTRDKKLWSRNRVRRCYAAELRLRDEGIAHAPCSGHTVSDTPRLNENS